MYSVFDSISHNVILRALYNAWWRGSYGTSLSSYYPSYGNVKVKSHDMMSSATVLCSKLAVSDMLWQGNSYPMGR